MLQTAADVGCTITPTEAPAQLERIEKLRPHVIGLERRRGLLALSFDRAADTSVIGEFIELERGCCSFLHIEREDTADAIRVTFSTDDRDREPALATIARTFDPAEPSRERGAIAAVGRRRNKTLLGALGVACLACFLPGLLAAGAAGSAAAVLGGETVIAGTTLAVVLAIGALITLRRRRSQSNSAGCGC